MHPACNPEAMRRRMMPVRRPLTREIERGCVYSSGYVALSAETRQRRGVYSTQTHTALLLRPAKKKYKFFRGLGHAIGSHGSLRARKGRPRERDRLSLTLVSHTFLLRLNTRSLRVISDDAQGGEKEASKLFLARATSANVQHRSYARVSETRAQAVSLYRNDPQPGVVRELYPWTAMCVRNVDVHVSCSSQVDAQLAAFFIDPRAK